jgi:hypothetical protein
MLPKAQGLDIDFGKLGQQMLRRREQLLADGFPPAKAARKKPTTARKRQGLGFTPVPHPHGNGSLAC